MTHTPKILAFEKPKTDFMEALIMKRDELLIHRKQLSQITRAPTKGIYANITEKIEKIDSKIDLLSEQNIPSISTKRQRDTKPDDTKQVIRKSLSSQSLESSLNEIKQPRFRVTIDDIPTVLLVETFSYLKPYEPIIGAQVCHNFLFAANDRVLWTGYLNTAMSIAKENVESLDMEEMKSECIEVCITTSYLKISLRLFLSLYGSLSPSPPFP